MFCCGPNPLNLKIKKLTPDFSLDDHYSENITDQLSRVEPSILHPRNCIDVQSDLQGFSIKQGESYDPQFIIEMEENYQDAVFTQIVTGSQKNSLWRVIGTSQETSLDQGALLKIGMTELDIYQIQKTQDRNAQKSLLKENKEESCRICFNNTESYNDPLVSLCKCTGTVRYIHLSCLRAWLMPKAEITSSEKGVNYYIFPQLICEICKSQWPLQFFKNGIRYRLLQFQDQENQQYPFIVFHHIQFQQLDSDLSDSSSLYQIDVREIWVFTKIHINRPLFLGSSQDEVQIVVSGSGISDVHCCINFVQNEIMITDCGSKSGTLVTAKEYEEFSSTNGVTLQCNLLVMKFVPEVSSWNIFRMESKHKLYIKQQVKRQVKKFLLL